MITFFILLLYLLPMAVFLLIGINSLKAGSSYSLINFNPRAL